MLAGVPFEAGTAAFSPRRAKGIRRWVLNDALLRIGIGFVYDVPILEQKQVVALARLGAGFQDGR
jgi:hypothetical protein